MTTSGVSPSVLKGYLSSTMMRRFLFGLSQWYNYLSIYKLTLSVQAKITALSSNVKVFGGFAPYWRARKKFSPGPQPTIFVPNHK